MLRSVEISFREAILSILEWRQEAPWIERSEMAVIPGAQMVAWYRKSTS